MTLECDAIGEEGLDAVTDFLKSYRPLFSVSLDDVSLCNSFVLSAVQL
jgi:hypothetical protein